MDLQALLVHFRGQIDDEAPPYLVSDDDALLYAIDAQDMLVRLTGGISDMTVAAADVGNPVARLQDLTVTAAGPYSAISPYILRVRSARLLTAKVDVPVVSESDLAVLPFKDYGWQRGVSLDDTDVGTVRFGILGIRDNFVRWFRVPDANSADTCRLHVYRLPFPRIAGQGDALEIGEEHHIHLVKWMKHLAYSKQDAEIYDKKLAEGNEAAFRAYCDQARRETERRRFKPRVVQYGGL